MRLIAGTSFALVLAALAGLATAATAAEPTNTATLKPAHGLSFDVGSKRAVGYFLANSGNCNLTVVLADRSDDADTVSATGSRVSVAVQPGKTARVDAAEGKSLEFACQAAAASMTVRTVEQVAWARN